MDKVVHEVIVSVLVLSLLIMAIPLFRNNMEIISVSAAIENDTDKVTSKSLLPLDKSEVSGSDVVSVIRYYSANPGVEILVTTNSRGTCRFTGQNYNPGSFPIPYEGVFSKSYSYEGEKLIKAVYTEK